MIKTGLFRKKENRSENSSVVTYEDSLLVALLGGSAGITRKQAMQIPTVRACVGLIADKISSLPLKLYEEKDGKVTEVLNDNRCRLINHDTGDTINGTELKKLWVTDYFMGKGSYTYIARDGLGGISGLYYVDESLVSINADIDPIYKKYTIAVNGKNYLPYEFLKILRNSDGKGKGKSIVDENPTALEIMYNTMKLENAMARKGGNKHGFLHTNNSVDPTSKESLREAWKLLYSSDSDIAEKAIILTGGMDFKEISATSVEMQLNQNKMTNAKEVCKLFCMPPEMLSGGASEAAQSLFVQNCIGTVLNTIEAALDTDLLLEREKGTRYFAFDVNELTRGDFAKRMNGYAVALDHNIMQVDEIREREDLKPLGFNYIKLGLQDVLLDPKTQQVYTPNTNQLMKLNAGGMIDKNISGKGIDKAENSGIMKSSPEEERAGNSNHDPKNGRFTEGMSVKLRDGSYGKLANGGRVTKIVTIAGGNTGKAVKKAAILSQKHKNTESDWTKLRGDGQVTYTDGITRHVELHWFESPQTGVKYLKVKREFV